MTARDLARDTRNELLLREKQHLEPLMQISPSATVITDLESNVVAWNPAAEALFGYTAAEAVGRNLDDLVAKTEDLHEAAVAFSERTVHQDRVQTITRRTRKDGTLVDVQLVAAPLMANGEAVGTFGIYHDITELQYQKRYYEALVEVSPEAIVTADKESNVTSWNPGAERLFGYGAEEAIGQNLDELIAKRADLRAEADRLSTQTPVGTTLTQRTRKDGSIVDVDVVGAPVVVGGEVVAHHVIYHDVSEIQRQKRYYEALLELSPTAIVTVDRENKVTSWNPAAEKLFGYTSEEAVGHDIDDLVANRDEVREEAIACSREISQREIRLVTRRNRKDGSLVDVSVTGAPIRIGDEVLGKYSLYHDVSELQSQKRYYEALVDISPAAIVAIDPRDNVTLWNPAAERLFGYSAAEAMGRNVDELVANNPDIRDEAVALSRTVEGDQIRKVTRRTRKDGSLVEVELLGAPVTIAGKLAGRYAIYLDIGELQSQKRYYESLLETSPTAIVTVDMTGTVTSWNPAAERLLGYSREETIGRNIDDLVASHPEIREEADRITREAQSGEQLHYITRRTRKDGSLVDVDAVAAPIYVGGETVGFYAMYSDISELQEQRRYFQSLLEVSPTAMVVTDLQTNVTSWNPAAEQLFGYTAEEAIGRHIDDLVATREDVRAEALSYSEAATKGERLQVVARRTRKDGSLVDVQLYSAPVVVEDRVLGFVAAYHDVGEIQRQRRYSEAVLQLSPTAIVTVDEQFHVTSWNPAAEQLFGYTAEEAIGRHVDDLVANSPEIRDEAASVNERGARGEGARLLTRRTRKDGSFLDVEMVAAPVYVAGERVGNVVIYHDISEIQRQKRYYETLIEVSPIAVVLISNEGTITSWSPAAERLFGYTAEEAIGKDIDDVVANDPEIREEGRALLAQALAGAELHAVTRRTRKDGTLVDVELLASPVFIGGERVGFYTLYHDISELQQARRDAEAAARAKSAFLATMSHEIRTPLNAVIGMTGLLLDTNLAPEQQRFAEVIRNSGDTLLSVINEILDFSKIEAGRLDLEDQPFDLSNCIESVLELVATTAAEKGLDLAYSLDPEVPQTIRGDETRLRQILLNLVNNAVKFTERGEVVLTLGATQRRGGNGSEGAYELHFAVRDTGIGIPEDRMDRLFESFSQVDASTTRRYGGTGLGLAISKRLVELMNGRMWVESRVGEGSTFHFTINAESAPAVPPAYRRRSPELQGKRVLIVDDNATNRQILRRQTESWGMLARETESPREALEWIRRGDPFDIGILDMQMPDMDGLTLAGEIRNHRDANALPLVMLTSIGRHAEPGMEEFAVNLTKPIKPSQLFDALMDVFGQHPAAEARAAPAAQVERPAPGGLRVLVAEDNAVNQQLAVLLLQKLGYRADLAGDGTEVLEALERQPYDVVLMDVQMPEMDGMEATRRIHQRWPAERRPYIIAVTANAMEGDREACLAAGMDDYLSKPIREEELSAALTRSPQKYSKPVLDPEALERLRQAVGNDEVVGQLARTFLEDSERILGELRVDITSGRAEETRRQAHSLKSTAATFGAMDLSTLCRELESVAQTGTLDGAKDVLARIQDEFTRVRAAIAEMLT
ncbi:MAG TPA: PAS domain S-box protein [Actinomycetota bacterium]|nr:PAS domain S-box protein [Actinomycetota bacterium]